MRRGNVVYKEKALTFVLSSFTATVQLVPLRWTFPALRCSDNAGVV